VREREDEAPRELTDTRKAPRRCCWPRSRRGQPGRADDDAVGARRLDVNGRVAGSCGDEQLQVRQAIEETLREWRALPHRHDDVEIAQPLSERVLVGEVVVERFDASVRGQALPVGHGERDTLVVIE
jgi:hypothetical protein